MRGLPTVFLVAVMACASGSTASDVAEIDPGEAFRLGVGEAAGLASENLTVKFAGVTADSRCPTGVNCFWAGDAEVELRLIRGEEETSMSLHTNGGPKYPRQAQAFGCTLRLEEVEPYPSSKQKIAPENYVVTVKLTLDESE